MAMFALHLTDTLHQSAQTLPNDVTWVSVRGKCVGHTLSLLHQTGVTMTSALFTLDQISVGKK